MNATYNMPPGCSAWDLDDPEAIDEQGLTKLERDEIDKADRAGDLDREES